MGLIIKLSLPVKKFIAFKRNRVAESCNTGKRQDPTNRQVRAYLGMQYLGLYLPLSLDLNL